jgi:hypothetical protein
MVGSYPLVNFPLKTAIDYLLFENKKTDKTQIRLIIITGISAVISVAIALAVPNISLIFGFIGSTVGTIIVSLTFYEKVYITLADIHLPCTFLL